MNEPTEIIHCGPRAAIVKWRGGWSSFYPEALEYLLGAKPPHHPLPAIIYDVEYQIGDGDYWCGITDRHLEEMDADGCFTMLWNRRKRHPRMITLADRDW
jgi:hypothetical protein